MLPLADPNSYLGDDALHEYGSRPCYPELITVIAVGGLHVGTEIAFSLTVARAYNAVAATTIGVYLVWRWCVTKDAVRVWGFRRDNFWKSLRTQLALAAPAAASLYGLGMFIGSVPLPRAFWLTVALYPLWGIAQQFALQNMIAKNLRELVPNDFARALISASLFGLSHYPRISLVLLAFFAGFCFTLIYQRYPNLWAVGFAHGLLGAMAFYIILQEDPGARILDYLDRFRSVAVQ